MDAEPSRLTREEAAGALRLTSELHPGTPLWQRAPTRDGSGQLLADFMMIVPGLNKHPQATIQGVLRRIEQALIACRDHVVFADFNLKLNVLWVTVRPIPGICHQVAAMVHHHAPEARLVAYRRD